MWKCLSSRSSLLSTAASLASSCAASADVSDDDDAEEEGDTTAVRIEFASEGAGELLKALIGWGEPRGPSKAGGGRQGGRLGRALDGLPADADAVAGPAVASRRAAPTEALTGLLGLCEGGEEWGSPRSAAALLAAKAACRASRWPPPAPPTGDGAL